MKAHTYVPERNAKHSQFFQAWKKGMQSSLPQVFHYQDLSQCHVLHPLITYRNKRNILKHCRITLRYETSRKLSRAPVRCVCCHAWLILRDERQTNRRFSRGQHNSRPTKANKGQSSAYICVLSTAVCRRIVPHSSLLRKLHQTRRLQVLSRVYSRVFSMAALHKQK
jgi:hypothetical protein